MTSPSDASYPSSHPDVPARGAAATPAPIIRAREETDADALAEMVGLPGVRWGTLRLPFPSRGSTREWLASLPKDAVALVAELDGRVVGSADLTPLRRRRSHVGEIGMAVHDEWRRRGVGTALLAALIDMADNWLNLRRLELTVWSDNRPAIALYEKFGFVSEGVRRAYAFRDGGYVDALMMGRLRGV